MKIYCSCCDKVQPVRVEDCLDAKTNEPFQDIVCNGCDLLIASGTGITKHPSLEEPVGWQPIETAPKDGQMILVCLPRQMGLVVRAWYRDFKGFWLTDQETDGGISRPAWFYEGDLWHPIPPIPDTTGSKT